MLKKAASKTVEFLKSFKKSEKGAVAIVFGISAIPVFLIAGIAIDCGRIFHVERKMTGAIDAAALAATKSLRDGASDARVIDIATQFFNDNMKGSASSYVRMTTLDVAVDRATYAVTITANGEVKMVFFQIAGPQFAKVDVPKTAVAKFDTKDIEIGLQLDVTGSMGSSAGGGITKMDALKTAVSDMLDIMLPDGGTSNRVRIGLAPFSSGVNAGDYAAAVTGGRAGPDGCTYERRNVAADQADDDAPLGAQALKARSELPGALACPGSAKVMAITDNKALLRTTVNRWSPDGYTAGHLGAAWAWYLVSPHWSSIWPAASRPAVYNDGKTHKIVILMTDGEYNTFDGRPTGSGATNSKRYAQDTCDAIRAKGVTVYTIGFMVTPAQKADLTRCAGGALRFYDARDGDALRDAFRSIAEEINNLRLSS